MVHELPEDEREEQDQAEPVEQDDGNEKPGQSLLDDRAESVSEMTPEFSAELGDERVPDGGAATPTETQDEPTAHQAARESYARITQIEVPSDVPIPMVPAPREAPRDRREIELPLDRGGAQAENPADDTFPPELRGPLQPREQSAEAGEPESAPPRAGEEGGRPLPQIMVLVTLADSRAQLEEVVGVASERMAPRFEQLADEKVRHAFWVKKCEERAADWRLRGP
jgi:hypothetical protein